MTGFSDDHSLAERLEVSVRTVYRDIDTLIASGVPIEGERGVGYILRQPVFLPPLNLTGNELQALQLGMEVVRQSADQELADAAERLLVKIDCVLPAGRRGCDHLKNLSIHVAAQNPASGYLGLIRQAIATRHILSITYKKPCGEVTGRRIRPLQSEYWGRVWTVAAWCELRDAFRVFRIDRIEACERSADIFQHEPGKTYGDFIAALDFEKNEG